MNILEWIRRTIREISVRRASGGHMTPRKERAIFALCATLALTYVAVSGISLASIGFVGVLLALLLVVLGIGN